jgi:hypothetical protein
MSVLTDTASYPTTPATARYLERPLFGHVIDGEVVPSLDGATMPGEAKTDAAEYLELVAGRGPGEGRGPGA